MKYLGGRILVREATEADGLKIAAQLREADRKEMWSAFRLMPEAGVTKSIRNSERAFVVELEGEAVAVFGVMLISLIGRRGSIWLLGTDKIDRFCITFGRYTKAFVDSFLMEWESLENWVHEENRKSILWLKMAGFDIEEVKPFGLDEENFHHVIIRREAVHDVHGSNDGAKYIFQRIGRNRSETTV